MKISKRAKQDYAIWGQISSDAKVVTTPKLTFKQELFWKELMRLYKRPKRIHQTNEILGEYNITETQPLIFYSGGLESSVIKAMYPTLPAINYLTENLAPWTNPIEPALMICGAGLGYGTIFYGSELAEGMNKKVRDFEDFHVYLAMIWKEYSRCNFLSPVSFLTKHDLFKIAIRDNIPFYSCFSNNSPHWCGKCYKCLLIDLMYKMEGIKSPIEMLVSEEDILKGRVGKINTAEINVYKKLKKQYESR